MWDECDAFFKQYGYDIKYLKKCGIEVKDGKAPKKPKSGRRLLLSNDVNAAAEPQSWRATLQPWGQS